MIYVLIVCSIAVTTILMLGQWLWLERRHQRQVRELRSKYTRYKDRAEEMLSSSKLQITSLKHQLSGAKLVARQSEAAFPKTIVQAVRPTVAADESLLMMFNDESRPMGYESGFARPKVSH